MIVVIVREILKEMAKVTEEHSFDALSVVLTTWVSLIFLIICVGFAIPICKLIFYHVGIVRAALWVNHRLD